MVSASKNTGAAGRLRLVATEGTKDAANNRSIVAVSLYLDERTSYPYSWSGGTPANYDVGGGGPEWEGSFAFDWRGGGLQSTLIASGTYWRYHNANGSGSVVVYGWMGNSGSTGAGGPTLVKLTLGLTTLKVLPAAPTGLSATRVSDSQIRLNWSQPSSASNGAPDTHIIQRRLNQPAGTGSGTGWDRGTTISAGTTAVVSADVNQKWEYRVWSHNAAGQRVSNISNPVYTTPAAPTDVTATKETSLDITVAFTPHVDYAEHNHEVWHGSIAGGVTTWDASPLATLASGVASYVHDSPNASQVHIYRVRAKAGTLLSGYSQSNSVQLLVAPNKPTVPSIPSFADKALAFAFPWVHNPQDTTPQKAYEFSYSTNGGSTWSTTGKVASSVSQRTIAANTYAANVALQMRVRTWGSATTGGSEGTGASPWSDVKSVTFKTRPTTNILAPADGATLHDATVRVDLGFTQAEGAAFVKATLTLMQDWVILEQLDTTQLIGTRLVTQVENGSTYDLYAWVQDSNGIRSSEAHSEFNVTYLPPVLPVVTLDYLDETGWGQVGLVIPDPGEGQSAVATVTITRRIDGGPEEVLVSEFPASDELTFFDTTPTIHGTNTYTITATTALGAQRTLTRDLVTAECRKAFLSKGSDYSNVVVFGANLEVDEALSVASATVQAAGRIKPIGLYGIETSVQLKVKSFVFENFGSPLDELRSFLLVPGKACFRDSTGRRTFGTVKGSVDYKKTTRGDLKFTLTETS